MIKFPVFLALFVLLNLSANISAVGAEQTITILTVDNRARLCPSPNCAQGAEILRIPTGTKLNIAAMKTTRPPTWGVTWLKVTYKGKTGWVSQYDTDWK